MWDQTTILFSASLCYCNQGSKVSYNAWIKSLGESWPYDPFLRMRLWHPELPPCWLGPWAGMRKIASTFLYPSPVQCKMFDKFVKCCKYQTVLNCTSAIFSALSLFKLVAEALWLTPSPINLGQSSSNYTSIDPKQLRQYQWENMA